MILNESHKKVVKVLMEIFNTETLNGNWMRTKQDILDDPKTSKAYKEIEKEVYLKKEELGAKKNKKTKPSEDTAKEIRRLFHKSTQELFEELGAKMVCYVNEEECPKVNNVLRKKKIKDTQKRI